MKRCMETDKKRRLGVFVFYDAEGIVDEYVTVLLESLKPMIDRLLILVNGKITDESILKLQKYSSEVILRKNIGFDGGAYKDAFTIHLKDEDLSVWDEVIVFNDTFYAPIFPWEEVFTKMGENTEVDFWGLTKHPGGIVFSSRTKVEEHVQGYFVVFRKHILRDEAYLRFWEELSYPGSYEEAVLGYEVGLTNYFVNNGFKYCVYTDMCDEIVKTKYGDNPYFDNLYSITKKNRIPILKIKSLSVRNYKQAIKTLNFLEEKSTYDLELITTHMVRLIEESRFKTFNVARIEKLQERYNLRFAARYRTNGDSIIEYFNNVRFYMPIIYLLGRCKAIMLFLRGIFNKNI